MKISQKRKYLIFFACVTAVFLTLLILMQVSVIGVSSESLGGKTAFDAKLSYYDGDYFYEAVSNMSGDAFMRYYVFHLCDYVFVLSYYTLMAGLLYLVLNDKFKKLAYILPAITALSDIWENLSIDILLFIYPTQSGYADFVGVLTCIKWYVGAVWAALTIALAVYKLYKYLRSRKVEGKE